jgi:capsular polysaccharide biosynthesis protein
VSDERDPEQLQARIETTRQQLGDTMAALSEKTDVKAQAKKKVADTKESLADKKDDLMGKARGASPRSMVSVVSQASRNARRNPVSPAVAGAFAVGFVFGWARR